MENAIGARAESARPIGAHVCEADIEATGPRSAAVGGIQVSKAWGNPHARRPTDVGSPGWSGGAIVTVDLAGSPSLQAGEERERFVGAAPFVDRTGTVA